MSNSGIGFIGLGQVGLGMANNLGQVARPFYAYDALEATKRLEGDDVIIASSVSNMAQNCHLIFLCLPSAKEVKEVIFGPDGIVDSALPNLSIIDTSTIDRTKQSPFITSWQAKALHMLTVQYQVCLFEPLMEH